MIAYERLIYEAIPGSTPKETYDNLMRIYRLLINIKSDCDKNGLWYPTVETDEELNYLLKNKYNG